jgi:TrmH family RNA methyltransferase
VKANDLISSRQNPLVKELQAIRDDRASPFMFLEGPRLVEELQTAGPPIDILVWTTAAEADPVVRAVQGRAKRQCRVSDSVFRAVSDVESPQGVLAIAKRPAWEWKDVVRQTPAPVLVLDGVQDPGNISTIVRTAEASGASGLVTTPGTARLFSPKALRGAMGSTLRLPILEHQALADISGQLKMAGYQLIGTAAQGAGASRPHTEMDWKKPCAIILGHEGQGLAKPWSSHVSAWVHIPMRPPVESLNVAAAAAIFLYESLRQRA